MSCTAEDGTISEALPGAQNRAGLTNSCTDVYINKGKEVITWESSNYQTEQLRNNFKQKFLLFVWGGSRMQAM